MRDDFVPKYERNSNPDKFSTYRKLCESRVRRLERYKKSKSFCSMDNISTNSEAKTTMNQSSEALNGDSESRNSDSEARKSETESRGSDSEARNRESTHSDSEEPVASSSAEAAPPSAENCNAFQMLKQKMISLIENDIQLFEKLLTLGDTIQDLREKQGIQNRSSSETSLSSNAEEDDEWRPMVSQPFSASMSAITRLYVEDDDDVDNLKPNVQYFSRKNSILRIPIPPRASNRYLGRRLINRDKVGDKKMPLVDERLDKGMERLDKTIESQAERNGIEDRPVNKTFFENEAIGKGLFDENRLVDKIEHHDKSMTLNSQSSDVSHDSELSQISQDSVGTTRNGTGNTSRNSDASLDSGIASAAIDAV
ncbi:unnamed protein product [Bursaphelenchus okinawaensis]|uniref:Uncharacterized protein n=1 Tax=Bursaphelenchus okinawaensis TaxID=465554 RepID=A0A811KAM2_9BILA|nr:unnamed protein product [Bursaphelenchus okinawaensis]CAG9095791.1 unnamed protein product [Bursaphelenchus okinawaensis]